MILPTIFFITILALPLWKLKMKKTSINLLFISILILYLCGNGSLASFMLSRLQSKYIIQNNNPEWGKKNVIILLGGGTTIENSNVTEPAFTSYSRINKAAQLYLTCKKNNNNCIIIISGGDPIHSNISEAEVYAENLSHYGIAKSDIVLETESKNTFENVKFTSPLLKQYDKIFLVTSGFHISRSLLYFSHFNTYPIPYRSDYLKTSISFLPTGYNIVLTDLAIHEYIGIARYYVYNFFHLNK